MKVESGVKIFLVKKSSFFLEQIFFNTISIDNVKVHMVIR